MTLLLAFLITTLALAILLSALSALARVAARYILHDGDCCDD